MGLHALDRELELLRVHEGEDEPDGETLQQLLVDISWREEALHALLWVLHWHARKAQVHGDVWDCQIAPGVVLERRRALEWLFQDAPGGRRPGGVTPAALWSGRGAASELEVQHDLRAALRNGADLEAVGVVRHQAEPEAEPRAVGSRQRADTVVAHSDIERAAVPGANDDAHIAFALAIAVGVQDGIRRRFADREPDLHDRVLPGAARAGDVRDRVADRR